MCKSHDIQYCNQTIGSLIKETRNQSFNKNVKRLKITKTKRELMHLACNKKCQVCNEEVEINDTRIDHTKPISRGGTNDDINLQALCKSCHLVKTQEELENHEYVRTSETESSFNSVMNDTKKVN